MTKDFDHCMACSASVVADTNPPTDGELREEAKQVEPVTVETVASDVELQRLRELLKQRDDEISIRAAGNTCTMVFILLSDSQLTSFPPYCKVYLVSLRS